MNLKRREFSFGATAIVFASSTIFSNGTTAQTVKPVAGKDYYVLTQPAPVDAPTGSVEVAEFFSYMCSVCNAFEPTFNAWAKSPPKGVVVRRVPVPFLANFESMQRLYFALEAMHLVDKLHGAVFAAIHIERRKLSDAATIADWVASKGVDRSSFLAQFNSFTVATKATRAGQLTNIYAIDGVPKLGVAGRFLTEGSAKGLRVVESLVGDLKAGR